MSPTKKAASFLSFVRHVEALEKSGNVTLFRGQAVEGRLLPGVARKDPAVDTTQEERLVIKQLELQGSSLLANAGSTPLDLLVVAQHHGLRTRLLDWTRNPLAALWFACSDSTKGDAYVYSLASDTLLEGDVYSRDPFDTSKTRVFQPRYNNSRIISQDGWFTLHRYAKSVGKFVALEQNPDIKKHLTSIMIPASSRQSMLLSLERHGITSRSVFPDLTGLCMHLNIRHKLV